MHHLLAPRLYQFAAVARAEHMTRAAERIGVPQPTLSRAMSRLEADLGIALFARSGRAMRLTPAGRTLLARAESALAELAAAADELTGDTDPARGRVTLGFLSTLGTDAVPRLLREFRDAHPGVRIELLQGRHAVLLDRLRDGAADLVLTSPLPDEPGLVATPLADEEVRLAVPAGHRLHRLAAGLPVEARGPASGGRDGPGIGPGPVSGRAAGDRRTGDRDERDRDADVRDTGDRDVGGRHDGTELSRIPLAEVADEPFLAFAPGYGLRGPVRQWCREAGVSPAIAFEGGDAATLRGLVGAGLGVTLLPAAPDVPGVVQLPVRDPVPVRTIGMVHRAGDRPTPPAETLRTFITGRAPHVLAH